LESIVDIELKVTEKSNCGPN